MLSSHHQGDLVVCLIDNWSSCLVHEEDRPYYRKEFFSLRIMVKAGGLIEGMESPDWLIVCSMEEIESKFYFISYFKLIPSKPFMVQNVNVYHPNSDDI
jgi:hypothetical protein